jgi:hypothetical protein
MLQSKNSITLTDKHFHKLPYSYTWAITFAEFYCYSLQLTNKPADTVL